MKVLDVSHLKTGIDYAVSDIDSFHDQISAIQRAVRDFYALDDALKGKAGDSIRTFFNEIHQPFLIYLYQSMVDYRNALLKMKDDVDSFESHPNGFVRQEFLEQDVERGFDQVKKVTTELTDEANSIIGSVQDLVSIKKVDASDVMDNVWDGKKKAKHIVEGLHTLDEHGASLLEQTKDDLQTMRTYLSDIESKFKNGDLSVSNFNIKAVQNMDAYQLMTDGIYERGDTSLESVNSDKLNDTLMTRQQQYMQKAGPYVMMMYPNLLFPITYRGHGRNGSNISTEDISKQTFIQKLAVQNRLTDEEGIALQNFLVREYTGGEEIKVEGKEADVNVGSSSEGLDMAREPITFADKRKVMGGSSNLAGDPFMLGHIAVAAGNTVKGAGIGAWDVGKDTAVGIANTFMHPIDTVTSIKHAAAHPIKTSQYIGNAIAESYERDMVSGDAESRSHWVTYAFGTVAASVVGTKGANAVTKAGATTAKSGAATTKAGLAKVNKGIKEMDISVYLPYAPRNQLAVPGGFKVPYNVVDGKHFRDQMILRAETSLGNNVKGTRYEGVRIINKKFAGKTYNLSGDLAEKYPNGVNFTKKGFPNFNPYSKANVKIDGLKGNTSSDFTAANKALGLKSTPKGYTWHHVEDGRTLMLVPTDLHQAVRHTGGAALIRKGLAPQ